MLNENLRLEATICLNGKILHETPIFNNFEQTFLSELTFIIKKKIFTVEEEIFPVSYNSHNSLGRIHVLESIMLALLHPKRKCPISSSKD